jgi:hypothetical protein
MFVNKIRINSTTLASGATATTINVPLVTTIQTVDNAELIERVFVDVETERAINPIIDYDKVRFLPLDKQGNQVKTITYDIYLINNGNYVGFYGDIGFVNDDITFRKESFFKSNLYLGFYDTDNPLTQRLVSYITLFPELKNIDLIQAGQPKAGWPKPASQIPIKFVVDSPFFNPMGFAEGYHIYDYKSELLIGDTKYLYMKAIFRNAKTGKATNMMVKNTAQPIDKLVHELYTRYELKRTQTGYYYVIDDTYQGNTPGPTNVVYNNGECKVTLYEVNAT